jgi:hypothetical protein
MLDNIETKLVINEFLGIIFYDIDCCLYFFILNFFFGFSWNQQFNYIKSNLIGKIK